jgi:hypothetical protein
MRAGFAVLALLVLSRAAAVAAEPVDSALSRASAEFGVPEVLLRAVSTVETGLHVREPQDADDEHPSLYCEMGLRDDDWFGHSLTQAAALIGASPAALKTDVDLCARGAAALLASLHGPADGDLTSWIEAVRRYGGIPGEREQNLYLGEVYLEVSRHLPITLPAFLKNSRPRDGDAPAGTLAGDDPELGLTWDPSPNIDVGAIRPSYIVIHDTEGNFAGALSWLKAPRSKVSAHFILRSRDGYGEQLVSEHDRAWHVRCWNPVAVGIEHEGFRSQPEYFTDEMVGASARLVRALGARLGIPLDAKHVFGHDYWSTPAYAAGHPPELGTCNTHQDPGPGWDWAGFFKLISGRDPIS